MGEFRIETDRLALREWRADDLDGFHAMFRDPEVMAFLGPVLDGTDSRGEVARVIARLQAIQAQHGCCFWALERIEDSAFLGFCGVEPGPIATPIENRLEIGWRLAHSAWGQGYAQEAARAAIDWVWRTRSDQSIWAITVPANTRSWGLMARLGMARQSHLDFDHPGVPDDSPLKRHITYRLDRPS